MSHSQWDFMSPGRLYDSQWDFMSPGRDVSDSQWDFISPGRDVSMTWTSTSRCFGLTRAYFSCFFSQKKKDTRSYGCAYTQKNVIVCRTHTHTIIVSVGSRDFSEKK